MENIVYGYITLDTLAPLGEEPFLDQLQILVAAGNRFDEKHVREVAAGVKTLLESRGHPVRRVDVPKPGHHPHADIMGLMLLAMAAFGLGVLVLSGILVVNLMAALMGAQVRQIGVMQTVGGKRRQIARIYLGQALLLGGAAVLVALPAGVLGSRQFASAMAVFLNFDLTSFAIPAWVYLSVVAVGLVVPLLAAAYPVWKGSGVSVREALSEFGLSQDAFGASRFDRALSGIGGTARPVLLAIRNSFRRRTRLVLTVGTLAAGGIFFLSALNTRASMISTLDRLFRGKEFDLTVSLAGVYRTEAVERAVRKTPGVRGWEGWITTEGALPEAKAQPGSPAARKAGESSAPPGGHGAAGHGGGAPAGDRFVAIALPVGTKMQRFDLAAGRGLAADDTNAIVVNTALAAKGPGMRVGNTVAISLGHGSMPWKIVGIVREPFSPPVAYVPKEYVDELGGLQGMTNSLRVAVDPDGPRKSIRRVKASLERNLEAEGVRQLGSLSKADSRFGFDQHMVMIYVALIVMSCVVGGVGALGLMTTMSLNVLERRREMGVLRAIGATPAAVWMIVVAEGCAVGFLSWAAAALAAWPVSRSVGNFLVGMAFKSRLDFSFAPLGPVVWLAVSLLFGAAASFLPAWHASRCPVREALEYE